MQSLFARVWILAVAAAACGGAASHPAPSTIAHVDGGSLAGTAHDGLAVYLGVPYAAPPVGDLRWRPPQPVPAWPGVRNADHFAPACLQTGVSMPGEPPPATSEDCLYLNVWAPAHAANARLPVLVWIHGGGYTNGATSLPLYAGDALAARGVIVVTIAYRLGAFGFLAHPALTRESAAHGSGNYALMDQLAALAWVQRNIAAFGGDPRQVTIGGQSAGAMAVSLLIASPRSSGLFARAIAQSGGVFEPTQLAPRYLLANAEADGAAFVHALGAASIADARRLPAATVLAGDANMITHPVVEPEVLPEAPFDAFTAGHAHRVPVLLGANADEARALVDLAPVTAANFTDELTRAWGPLPPPLVAAYPFHTDAEARTARADLERDLRFAWDMWAWARLATAAHDPVWSYQFALAPPFPADGVRAHWGASHFAELWYMFGHLDQERWAWRARDRALSNAMVGYWINFVRTGDPNGPGLPRWPAFADASQVLVLGDPIHVGGVPNLDRLQVFDAIYTAVRGGASP
jgi:para-nitrobenzyl esterase